LRVLPWKMLVYFVAIWYYLSPYGIVCGHWVYYMVILVYFSRFGMLYPEKSGNPESLYPAHPDMIRPTKFRR
jgi:hypothetical protein